MKRLVLAITGASGAIYARRLAQEALRAGGELHLVVSPHGARLLADELGVRRVSVESILGWDGGGDHQGAGKAGRGGGAAECGGRAILHGYRDIGDVLASGSYHTDGMVICPCSSNTLAAVAAGLADNLITRAAQVTLKEARRLILVPREMPLSQIELANMLRISQAGGILCPACPGFYLQPQRIEDLVDFVVGRVLDLLGVPHSLRTRWAPRADPGAAPDAAVQPDTGGEVPVDLDSARKAD